MKPKFFGQRFVYLSVESVFIRRLEDRDAYLVRVPMGSELSFGLLCIRTWFVRLLRPSLFIRDEAIRLRGISK